MSLLLNATSFTLPFESCCFIHSADDLLRDGSDFKKCVDLCSLHVYYSIESCIAQDEITKTIKTNFLSKGGAELMTSRREDGYDSVLATRIRATMDNRRIKIKDLADITGITRQSIGYYADGTNVPNALVLAKIADALKVSTDYLLGRTDNENVMQSGFPFETCADAVRIIDLLETINNTSLYVSDDDRSHEFSSAAVEILIRDPGIVEYYSGREKTNKAVRNLPASLFESGFQFQTEARKMLMEKAQDTRLDKVRIADDEDLPF